MADPYRNFKFEVEIQGFVRAGFSKVSGLEENTEVVEYREGGDNETARKLSGQSSFGDVVLERGKSDDDDFNQWRQQIYNPENENGEQGTDDYKRKVVIYLKNKAGTRVKKWTVYRAWPMTKGEPDLDASANDVAIETLTLANEGIKEETL